MARHDRRLERRLRFLERETEHCQREASRHRARCAELEERARRNAERAKAFDERAVALAAERAEVLAQLDEPTTGQAAEAVPEAQAGSPPEDPAPTCEQQPEVQPAAAVCEAAEAEAEKPSQRFHLSTAPPTVLDPVGVATTAGPMLKT